MDRREFLKAAMGTLGSVAVGALGFARAGISRKVRETGGVSAASEVAIKLFGRESETPNAVLGALALIGGITKVIKSGDTVVIKPNLAARNWSGNDPFKGEVTNPKVMEGVIKAVVDAGAKPIVAEGTADWFEGTTKLFAQRVGLLEVCRKYGAKFVDLNNDDVVKVLVPDPIVLDEVRLSAAALECDKFISVPVMKTHYHAGVTLGMKNMVGTLSPKFYGVESAYVRMEFHNTARRNWRTRYGDDPQDYDSHLRHLPLSAGIADLNSARRIDLTAIDGTYGREGQSPTKGPLVDIKERCGHYMIIVGTDPVATDTICAHLMRQPMRKIHQLRFAHLKGLGNYELESIIVKGAVLDEVSAPFSVPRAEYQY